MIQAVLRGKLAGDMSKASPRSEDLLTSSFFGLLSYLPFDYFRIAFAKLLWFDAKSPKGEMRPDWLPAGVAKVEYRFWHWFNREEGVLPGEIDLLLTAGRVAIAGVEVKFDSTLHNRDEEDNQLTRYWRALRRLNGGRHCLVYLTKDLEPPDHEIADALRKAKGQDMALGWISWSKVHESLARCQEDPAKEATGLILKDLKNLLEYHGLHSFNGFPVPVPTDLLVELRNTNPCFQVPSASPLPVLKATNPAWFKGS